MPRRSPNQASPNQDPKRRLSEKRILLGAVLASGALLVTTQLIKDPGAFGDIAHATIGTEDAREKKIREALATALDLEVSVHCVPAWEEIDGAPVDGKHPKLFGIKLDIIRLRDEVCDDATGDLNARPSTIDVMTIAHEAAHVQQGYDGSNKGESITECFAFQTMPNLAKALGASETTVEWMIVSNAWSSFRRDEYVPPADCVDGGPYDLHPEQSGGTFPTVRQTG